MFENPVRARHPCPPLPTPMAAPSHFSKNLNQNMPKMSYILEKLQNCER